MIDKEIEYKQICSDILGCSKCDLGCDKLDGFNPRVAGCGNINSKIIFMAEAPGFNETQFGKPLIPPGTSGKKYEEVLRELGLTREQVYTTNSTHCRPPQNRDPLPWESLKCLEYIKREICLINPEIIVTFGRFAALTFLDSFKMTKDHGKLQVSTKFKETSVFPLFHPAYIMAYAPHEKREQFKQDIKALKNILIERKIIPMVEAK